MVVGDANFVISLFERIDIYILIVIRLVGFFLVLPVLSGQNIPSMSKVALACAIAYLIFASGKITTITYEENIVSYGLLILKEFMVGFIIAYVVYLLFSIFYFVGQLIDYQVGFSMVSVLDPLSQIQVPVTGNLLYFVICVLFVQTGGMNMVIAAFYHSYDALPIGSAVIVSNGNLMYSILELLTEFFVTGFKVSLPIVGSILVLDVALGILVKAVPQMNIFVVGMPIKLLIGLMVFMLIVPVFSSVYDYVFNESYRNIIHIIGGMTP